MKHIFVKTVAGMPLETIQEQILKLQEEFAAGKHPSKKKILVKGMPHSWLSVLRNWARLQELESPKWVWVTFIGAKSACLIPGCKKNARFSSELSYGDLCLEHKREEVEWIANENKRYDEELEAMAREDAMESRPDPVCVCGVSRSEHMLAGCEQFEARRN